jgi:hypothetical protein
MRAAASRPSILKTAFHRLTDRTIETGIICKTGKRLSAVLWIGDVD